MKSFVFILLLLPFSLFAQKNEGKLFIIGGGKRPPALIKRLAQEAELEKGYAIILAMSSSEPDTASFYAKKQFVDLGYTAVTDMFYTTKNPPKITVLDSIRNANLIYITGGDQNRFMARIKDTGIQKAIKECYQNGGTIAGTSAGAAVMSNVMLTGDEKNYPDYRDTGRSIESDNLIYGIGLGMLENVIIDQHFIQRSRYNRLMTAVLEHPTLKGIGIDESTAILVQGKHFEVVGDSQVIVMTSPKGIDKEQPKIRTKQLQMSVLGHGDTMKL